MKDTAYSAFLKPQLFAFGFGRTLNERTFPSDGWEILRMRDRKSEGAKVFANPADCREIVDSLSPAQRRELVMALCRHRWTHVPKQIEKHENWKMSFFKVNEIYAAAGDCPDKCEMKLEILALSPALIALESFNKLPLEEDVEFDEFIGLPRDERVILTDGNHRAIHQARRILGGYASIKVLKVITPDTSHPSIFRSPHGRGVF